MNDNGTILLIEDNIALNIANSRALKLRGYTVLTAENLTETKGQILLYHSLKYHTLIWVGGGCSADSTPAKAM